MNLADVLARRQTLREKKDHLTAEAMNRFDVEMQGKSVAERQKRLVYGPIYTAEELSQLAGFDKRISGVNHMLQRGFFTVEQIPRKDDEEEPLY